MRLTKAMIKDGKTTMTNAAKKIQNRTAMKKIPINAILIPTLLKTLSQYY